MIPVAPQLRTQIRFMPVGKNEVKIQRRFLAHHTSNDSSITRKPILSANSKNSGAGGL